MTRAFKASGVSRASRHRWRSSGRRDGLRLYSGVTISTASARRISARKGRVHGAGGAQIRSSVYSGKSAISTMRQSRVAGREVHQGMGELGGCRRLCEAADEYGDVQRGYHGDLGP